MKKIKVNIEWYDHNFGASLGDDVPGSVVLTAKTYRRTDKRNSYNDCGFISRE